ncbi:SixA phosphatase family protein [Flindersiella endophytica]
MTRTLVLLRHGKAESPVATADIDRPLSNRGRGQSLLAGEALRERDLTPQRVVISPSLRTRETWDACAIGLAAADDVKLVVEVDDRIYANTLDELLDVVNETGDDIDILLVVGHNPSVAGLAGVLDEDGSGPAHRKLAEGFPTGALAVFELDVPWAQVRAGSATLKDLIRRQP